MCNGGDTEANSLTFVDPRKRSMSSGLCVSFVFRQQRLLKGT